MLEYLKQEDKELFNKVTNHDIEDVIKVSPPEAWSTERLIFNQALNKMGLQVARCILSRRMNEARQDIRSYDKGLLEQFRKDGCLVLDDVFSEKDVKNNVLHINDRYVDILRMTLGDDTIPSYSKLEVQSMPAYRGTDPQCDSHFDTFHPTCKVWVYLHDVTLDHAPLHFAKGTHINDENRLRFMYELSLRLDRIAEGDFRDFKNEFEEPLPILGKKFTTIFVDVAGFHKRGNGKLGFNRVSARGNVDRKNPFRDINV